LFYKRSSIKFDLKVRALKSGISNKEWDAFEKEFILSENAVSLIK